MFSLVPVTYFLCYPNLHLIKIDPELIDILSKFEKNLLKGSSVHKLLLRVNSVIPPPP